MTAENVHDIEKLAGFAKELVGRLGEEALSYYGKGKTSVKFDEDLVTAAELQLTMVFEKELQDHYPEHLLFENNQGNDGYTHEERRYLWIHDPIDGVDNFQTGIPIWGISLALLENFWPIFGLFYMPATGDLFHARADRSAYRGEKKITVANQKNVNDDSAQSVINNHGKMENGITIGFLYDKIIILLVISTNQSLKQIINFC